MTDAERKAFEDAGRQAVEKMRKAKADKGGKKDGGSDEGQASVSGNKARLIVTAPADARLWVDQVECPLPGSTRSFETPALNPDQTYAYTLRIAVERNGQMVEESRRVRFAAGQEVAVDFSGVGAVRTASTDE